MGSLMGSIGFVPRVVLCFLSSLGSFPLTSFFSREPLLPVSNRVGTGPTNRSPHPSSATFQTFWGTIFVILSGFLSFCLSIPSAFPAVFPAGSPRLLGQGCQVY